MLRWLFAISLFFLCFSTLGQTGVWKIVWNGQEENNKDWKGVTKQNYKTFLQAFVAKKIEEGYLTASVDEVLVVDSLKQIHVKYYEGERFECVNLDIQNVDIVTQLGYSERFFVQKPFRPKEYAVFYQKVLTFLENNGYPFASVGLGGVVLDSNKISANLNIEKGQRISIDTIYIKSNEKIAIETVYNYIGIHPKDWYSESALQNVKTRIEEVPYWKEIKPLELEFKANGTCSVYIYLKSTKANSFNGVLGLQPDGKGKTSVTGDAKVKLVNSFYRGETVFFNWRKTQQLTQALDLGGDYPFLFNTKFGIDFKANLYKKDTTFLNSSVRIGVDYLFSGRNKFTLFFENKSSVMLSAKQYSDNVTLPDVIDVKMPNYGIALHYENLDYRFNPRKGVFGNLSASFGQKKISKNQLLPLNLYDSIELHTVSYQITAMLQYFIPLKRKSVILLRLRGESYTNSAIFINELYRLGGERTIRGFDEESIYASSYGVITMEYRYLIERNSNLFIFIDYGILEQNLKKKYSFDELISFGSGISFETKPGIFRISYALGARKDSPFYVKTAKVHFGFVSFF